MRLLELLLAGGVVFLASSAQASLVTFSDPDSLEVAYSRCTGSCAQAEKDGYAYTVSLSYNFDASYYLHDDGGATRSELWRVDGQRFDVLNLTYNFYNSFLVSGPSPFVWPEPDFKDVSDEAFLAWAMSGIPPQQPSLWIRGYRDGVAVAEIGTGSSSGRHDLAPDFSNLDYLEFELDSLGALPNIYFVDVDLPPNTLWCADYCMSLRVVDMTYALAPPPATVPLPASGAALIGGVFALAAIALRRRRTSARSQAARQTL